MYQIRSARELSLLAVLSRSRQNDFSPKETVDLFQTGHQIIVDAVLIDAHTTELIDRFLSTDTLIRP
jgi:hypothetical protein